MYYFFWQKADLISQLLTRHAKTQNASKGNINTITKVQDNYNQLSVYQDLLSGVLLDFQLSTVVGVSSTMRVKELVKLAAYHENAI
jgi:hypothetical protein